MAVPDSNGARILVQGGLVPDGDTPVEAGIEYYAFKLNVARSKSTGADACSGCDVPVCLWLEEMTFYPRSSSEIREISDFSPQASWHPAYLYIWDDFEHHTGGIGCAPDRPTISKRSTWGRVKSLYR
jgi:hypothetical protein